MRIRQFAMLGLSVLLVGCSAVTATPTPIASPAVTAAPTSAPTSAAPQVRDADGALVTIADASRIVALGGPVTEIVYALGAEHQLVGVDTSSLYPDAATKLPQVGYQRSLAAEGVLSLKPTLILGTTEAGPPDAIAQLRASGITTLILPVEDSADGARAKIRAVAASIGRVDAGEQLVTRLDTGLKRSADLLAKVTSKPKVLFVYARGAGSGLVAGTKTGGDAMIALAGATNAVTAYEGYKPLTAEAAVAAAPDVILMLTGGLESVGGIDGLLKEPGIAQTPAGRDRRIVAVDDLLLLSFGPRLGEAVVELTRLLHPEVDG